MIEAADEGEEPESPPPGAAADAAALARAPSGAKTTRSPAPETLNSAASGVSSGRCRILDAVSTSSASSSSSRSSSRDKRSSSISTNSPHVVTTPQKLGERIKETAAQFVDLVLRRRRHHGSSPPARSQQSQGGISSSTSSSMPVGIGTTASTGSSSGGGGGTLDARFTNRAVVSATSAGIVPAEHSQQQRACQVQPQPQPQRLLSRVRWAPGGGGSRRSSSGDALVVNDSCCSSAAASASARDPPQPATQVHEDTPSGIVAAAVPIDVTRSAFTRSDHSVSSSSSHGVSNSYSPAAGDISATDCSLAVAALNLASQVYARVWSNGAAAADSSAHARALSGVQALYGRAMESVNAIQDPALAALVKQAVRTYFNPYEGDPAEALCIILRLLNGAGAGAVR